MRCIDAVILKAVYDKAANRIIGEGREQCRLATEPRQCHRDIACRAANIADKPCCRLNRAAIRQRIEIHPRTADDKNSTAVKAGADFCGGRHQAR